jgi:hypothetical protein
MTTPPQQTINAARLIDLQSRLVEIDQTIAKLDGEYAAVAAEFAADPSNGALRQAERLEQQTIRLKRERALAVAASERIAAENQAAEAQAEQAAKAERSAQARAIALRICALHVEIDVRLRELTEHCAQRVSLLAQLGQTELVDPALVMRLSGRQPVTRACCAAGLHVFAELQATSPQGRIALADSNPLLSGIGRDSSQPAPHRVRLEN